MLSPVPLAILAQRSDDAYDHLEHYIACCLAAYFCYAAGLCGIAGDPIEHWSLTHAQTLAAFIFWLQLWAVGTWIESQIDKRSTPPNEVSSNAIASIDSYGVLYADTATE